MPTVRIGIVGLGANTRLRHVPGLQACQDVQIVGVCNRRSESTEAAASEFGIPRKFARWEDLIADPEIDAVLIGTWPYLHCPITLAALEAGKHVLTEARMARNAEEAHLMHQASQKNPQLAAQIVPSPFGLRADKVVKEMIVDGFLGELREVVVLGVNNSVADPQTLLHWRQSAELSGLNMLLLGILHETLIRWTPDPIRVLAQTHIFTPQRLDETTGENQSVGTPDSVHLLTELPDGAQGAYHLSGAAHFGPSPQIHLYGSCGTIKYLFAEDRLMAAKAGQSELKEVTVPPGKAGGWRVEEEFIDAIRGRGKIEFTDFATGVRYMEFTEAVARSAQSGSAVALPLK